MLDFFIKASEIDKILSTHYFWISLLLVCYFYKSIPEALLSDDTDADFYPLYCVLMLFEICDFTGKIFSHAIFILNDYPGMELVVTALVAGLMCYSIYLVYIIYKILTFKHGALTKTKQVLLITPILYSASVALVIFASHCLTDNNLEILDQQLTYVWKLFKGLVIMNWPWLLFFLFYKKINALWKLIDDPQKGARPACPR